MEPQYDERSGKIGTWFYVGHAQCVMHAFTFCMMCIGRVLNVLGAISPLLWIRKALRSTPVMTKLDIAFTARASLCVYSLPEEISISINAIKKARKRCGHVS